MKNILSNIGLRLFLIAISPILMGIVIMMMTVVAILITIALPFMILVMDMEINETYTVSWKK